MLNALFDLARPFVFALDPEQAHEATLKMLESGLAPRQTSPDDPILSQRVMGLDFPNPFGVAAGFDKDARVPNAIINMGFGHTEVGSLTPLAQVGNPKPRVFRLIRDRAVINRLGFNNGGHAPALARLQARTPNGVLGVNVGANKDSTDRAGDYVKGIETFYRVATYFTVNISSPNTPGLRDLQAPAALDELLVRVLAARDSLAETSGQRRPIVVKIAPDIAEDDLPAIVERLTVRAVDGIAVSNTTLSRHNLSDQGFQKEAGGLSGRPLFHRSTVTLARVFKLTGGKIPLIGIGGIDSGSAAVAKVLAGASLLQLYTGMIYEGPGLLPRMKLALANAASAANVTSIAGLIGRDADNWASKPLEIG
jgi:dihydroorotate dehydrogenase